jgi:transposase
MVPSGDHDCDWKEYALQLQQQLADVAEKQRQQEEQLDALKKKIFGKRSEKMPPMDREVRRGKAKDPEQRQQARRANAELRAKRLETESVNVSVPADERHCPKCGGEEFSALMSSRTKTEGLSRGSDQVS